MTAEALWTAYCRESRTDPAAPHTAWAFGGAPDKLAELVLRGVKTATASGYDLYFLPGQTEPLPAVGDLSVILNAQDEAVCIIRTTALRVLPFDEVDEAQAWKEGEGDRSLAHWRQVHEAFFTEDFRSCGAVFTPKSRILCEEFVRVYPL